MRLRSRSALTLASLAGLAASAHAAVFTFTPTCAPFNWNSQCAGAACGGGQFTQTNNFGQTSCGGTPLLPGGGDDVIFAGDGTINVGVNVRTLTVGAAHSVAARSNITTSNGVTNNGLVSTSGASNISFTGPFTNAAGATWIEGSNSRFLNAVTFNNNGTLELRDINLINNTAPNLYTNNATILKTTAGTATFFVPVTNNSLIDVQAGTLSLTSTTYTGSPTSNITVAASGAAFTLSNCNITGRLNASGPGDITSSSGLTANNAVTLNVASNLRLLGGLTAGAGTSFTNTGRLNTSGASNLTYTGTLTNALGGTWIESSNGRFFNTVTFTNAGLLELQSISFVNNISPNIINNTGTIRKTVAATSADINVPINNSGTIDVQAGTFNLNSTTYTGVGSGSLTVASGAAANLNSMTLAGTLNFTGAGTLTSNSGLTVTGASTLNTTSPFRIFGNVTVSAGNSLTNQGTVSTSGAGNLTYTGTLTNGASGTWIEQSNGRLLNNATLLNDGLLELRDISFVNNIGANAITNNNIIRKTGPDTATFSNVPFNNNGQLQVQAGTVQLSSLLYTAVPAANISVASGATLNIANSTLAGTVNCSGTGTARTTGTLTVAGNVTTSTTTPLQVLSNVTVTAGNSLTNEGNVSTGGAGSLTYSGPIVNGVNGTWFEGSNTRFFNTHTFTNNGQWEWQSINFANNTGTNLHTNNATLRISGPGTASTNVPFVNNAIINAVSGTLAFTSTTFTGNGASVMNVTSPAAVSLTNMTIAGTLRATGNGNISTTSALTASGTATVNTAQPFRLLGALTATGAGNSFINTGNLSTSGASSLVYSGVISNGINGTWIEQSNTRFFNSVTFTNQGTLELRDINLSVNTGSNLISNSGTLIKSEVSTATCNIPLGNTGLIDVREGTFSLSGAFSQIEPAARTLIRTGATLTGGARSFANGRLEGRGTHTGNVTLNAATISPGDPVASSGTFNITGTLTMQSGSAIEIDVPAPVNPTSDRVIVSSQAAVAGTVVVNVPSGYNPPLGEVYEIIRSNTSQRTGTFTSLVINADPGIAFALSYNASSVLLTVTATNCDDIDFNNNDVYPEDQDVVDFFNVLAGSVCPTCNDVDFNNNNVFPEDQDIIDFFTVLAGGNCP